jgi:hypothetical protein
MDHFAQQHAAEIEAEMVPTIARNEARAREAIKAVRGAMQALDDVVFEVNAIEATKQAGETVPSVMGSYVGQMLKAAGAAVGEPFTRLPTALRPFAEEMGVITQGEIGQSLIAANLPHPSGVRSAREMKREQSRRGGCAPGDGRMTGKVADVEQTTQVLGWTVRALSTTSRSRCGADATKRVSSPSS